MLNAKLEQRMAEFLPQVRVGMDFGEGAGGIAVVRGNKILHAETYVDFHETTLEQRRQLRRGRRTRSAKKMRLARLRSWVLRQRLPDGSRLTDPYTVMRDPHYHVQPGVFETAGRNPAEAPSWVDLAKQGKTNAAGFVKALTLIFQKRGYKWDAIALEEMSDAKLKDFLASARIPNDELYAAVKAQIERRKQEPDHPVRGKPRVPPDELVELLERARGRPRQPRLAEHRDVKAAELVEVVEGFGRAAGLSPQTVERWQKELCGLLNKILRPARFENRLRTGCAWCGKPTPRKSKVRHIAYAAAVCNLRAREGRVTRPLTSAERGTFWGWWELRERTAEHEDSAARPSGSGAKEKPLPKKDTVPKLAGIEGHLKRLGAQVKMARQIYDLLWNSEPKGRTGLCNQHLEMAAKGATMKDAGVQWQTISVRKSPNPCRERHDERVLHRVEQILFKPGERGEAAWRYGPVGFVTLEVPAPQTERARKGEQKQRKVEPFMERLAKETGGVCIYCDPAKPRPAETKDHIFPHSRGGPDVWDNLVPACKHHNDQKGDRTPWEWLGGSETEWRSFVARVEALARDGVPEAAQDGDGGKKKPTGRVRISERKRQLLLLEDHDYPENPTPLAHVGSRPRQFVSALGALFKRNGVKPPRIDYQLGEPLVQRIDGRTTAQLRKSWLKEADETTDNFPVKDPWDLLNHAQDAALIAACPPHTWRETIFCRRAVRPVYGGRWAEQDGLAVHELAPDWAEYMGGRTWPLVRPLGRYPVGWKRTFADQNFYQNPDKLDDKRLRQYVPLASFPYGGKGPDAKPHSAETRIVAPGLDREFRKVAHELGLKKRQTLPPDKLQEKFPSIRHVKVEKQPGGRLARVTPTDGPPRKVQLKKASEAAVFWIPAGKNLADLAISVRWPSIFRRFGVPRHDPPIPEGATILEAWKRHKMVWLDEAAGQAPGYYRVKEFSDSGVTVLPENAVTDELAKRLGLKKRAKKPAKQAEDNGEETAREGASSDKTDSDALHAGSEVVLGKKDLVAYFLSLRKDDKSATRSCRGEESKSCPIKGHRGLAGAIPKPARKKT